MKRDISELKLIPGTGGVFEVSVNGKKIYSKLQSGQHPDPEAILRSVRSMLS